ncbi:MAG TPA: heparan-alpha-glucosaminide N-acetyltransferase domain-containing protein [Gemmatimonadaceae bacterium]|nr:heparan-alpha-glucosaminide N-acetyltransferase domain-containing protein [Gemmatimonadaceae bacterium]
MSVVRAMSEKNPRFGSIDAVRGAAILFVFLAHFTAGYAWPATAQTVAGNLRTVSMIASPTFVLVSGMVAGFLAFTNPHGFGELRVKLLDRGLFLLLLGHLFLTLTLAPGAAGFSHAYRTSFITDAIAVAILIGPSMVTAISAPRRFALAVSIFVVDWWLISHWHPIGTTLTAKLYIVGMTSPTGELSGIPVFPVVPWFAVYLAGTVVGEKVGRMYVAGREWQSHLLVALVGAASVFTATVAHLFVRAFRNANPSAPLGVNDLSLVSIYGKFPPGAVYLGFFGGAGLLMLASIFELDRRNKLPLVFGQLRKLGRSSLFLFTIQYSLYRAILPRLGYSNSALWPVFFLASVGFLAALATVWDRHSANRFLTVGITAEWRRHRELSAAVANHSFLRTPATAGHHPTGR